MKFYDREAFNDQKVEAIRIQLTNLDAMGKPADYQVILDDMEIVPRTNDVERFTSFYDLISPQTQNLIINVFSGATRHKHTYSFYFSEGKQSNTLNGIDTEKVVDERVARATLEMTNKILSEQVKDLKEELLNLEAENEQLNDDNQQMREDLKKSTGENGIANTVMGGMERLFNRYMPQTQAQQNGLTGPQQNYAAPQGTINLPLNEYDQFKSFATLAEKFEPHEFDKVLHIIRFLSQNKPAIDETMSFLTEEEEEEENPNNNDSQKDHN